MRLTTEWSDDAVTLRTVQGSTALGGPGGFCLLRSMRTAVLPTRATRRRWLAAALVLSLLTACGSTPDRERAVEPGATGPVDLDGRPFQLHVPPGYDRATKAPLVVLLHGYTSDAAEQESYFKLTAESDRRGFLYAMPDGTTNQERKRFWNATDACCDFYRNGVDDSAYLSRLIDTVKSSYSVDSERVYLVGHSNGGFMAHRMACEHSDQITAVVSLAGMLTNDTAKCTPARPVSVLQIHGTDDETIAYNGGMNGRNPYPSVATTLATWRRIDGCGDEARRGAPIDLESALPGAETTVTTYSAGCRDATRVELWAIKGGRHVPAFTANFAPAVVDFLYGTP
jgi:polyhydroxybutyrate depolymerase